MPQKLPMRDLVILLPGITGSILRKDEKDVWAPTGQALGRALVTWGDSVRQLAFSTDDDTSLRDLDDGVRATGLVPGIHGVFGLNLIDGYAAIIRMITSRFQVIEGSVDDTRRANFILFPYDWRRDNRSIALRLQQLVDTRLAQWCKDGPPDAKVILLAHSMGGLIARYYVEVLEGWRNCRALITFGTPHRGSVNALDYLSNGYKRLFLELTETMRSFPSVYQLLPIYEMLTVNGREQRVTETDALPSWLTSRASKALAFHREIEAAVERHLNEPAYLRSFKTIPIVGTRQPTFQSARLIDGKIALDRRPPAGVDPTLADGDGTVPRVSAIPIELSADYRETYYPERHAWLHGNSRILDDLLERLKHMQIRGLKNVRGPEVSPTLERESAIGLELDNLYRVDEPVIIKALLINLDQDPTTLEAQVTPVTISGATVTKRFIQSSAGWELTLNDLRPGLYRLEVRTDQKIRVPSVHDVFEVLG